MLLVSCGGGDDDSSEGRSVITGKYDDGTYCADVTYYNPNTGTRNTYTLNIEVENNEVARINWGNGGWLDGSHFNPEELDSYGYCSFTSDKGYKYEVQISGSECSSTDNPGASSDDQEDEEKSNCPKCGDEKEDYDYYCYWCKRKIEDEEREKKDKEEHTCPKCGRYDSFMFSTDDECSDCERKRKREEEEEEEEERRRKEDEEERERREREDENP